MQHDPDNPKFGPVFGLGQALAQNAPEDDEVNVVTCCKGKTTFFPSAVFRLEGLPSEVKNRIYGYLLPSMERGSDCGISVYG